MTESVKHFLPKLEDLSLNTQYLHRKLDTIVCTHSLSTRKQTRDDLKAFPAHSAKQWAHD